MLLSILWTYSSGKYPRLVAIFSGLNDTSLVAEIPYLLLGSTTALVMVASEAVTMAFRPPSIQRVLSRRAGRSIANLIPFTNLNLIFAFSIIAIIAILLVLEQAFPKFQERPFLLGIQMNLFLSCLLITNPEAIERLGRRLKAWLGERVEVFYLIFFLHFFIFFIFRCQPASEWRREWGGRIVWGRIQTPRRQLQASSPQSLPEKRDCVKHRVVES